MSTLYYITPDGFLLFHLSDDEISVQQNTTRIEQGVNIQNILPRILNSTRNETQIVWRNEESAGNKEIEMNNIARNHIRSKDIQVRGSASLRCDHTFHQPRIRIDRPNRHFSIVSQELWYI
jgi:hypothetical protein